jgi:hypothetical protein
MPKTRYYCVSMFINAAKVRLVVWLLHEQWHLYLVQIYINSKKRYSIV